MKKSFILSLSLFPCLGWAQVSVQTLTFNHTFELNGTQNNIPFSHDFHFNQIDPTQFVITSATLDMGIDYSMTGTGFNFKKPVLTGAVNGTLTNTLFSPTGATSTSNTGSLFAIFDIPGFGTQTFSNFLSHRQATTLNLSAPDINRLYGTGTVPIHLDQSASTFLSIIGGIFDVSAIGSNTLLQDNVQAKLTINKAPVPEPASLAVLGVGLVGLARKAKRSRRTSQSVGGKV